MAPQTIFAVSIDAFIHHISSTNTDRRCCIGIGNEFKGRAVFPVHFFEQLHIGSASSENDLRFCNGFRAFCVVEGLNRGDLNVEAVLDRLAGLLSLRQ